HHPRDKDERFRLSNKMNDIAKTVNTEKAIYGKDVEEAERVLHIRKCIAYIYSNLNADLSVKGLAAYLGLDPSYLSRLFSKETGSTVKRFVTKAKISTACDLLRNTSLRYIEIAYSLGFSTQSMFIRTFKSETGLTPKKYREQYGG
ncbi:MAG: helix-turn-helix transcriptional regulator, partial [Oscillospiraceae bacterium]|nr:helix-turn-helix transcriptional regulator [Oscillospiraceae bacterium]